MNLVDEECVARCWRDIRERGRQRFILRYGVQRFAVEVGLMVTLVLFVVIPVVFETANPPELAYFGTQRFWVSLVASFVFWPAAGYLWGAWEWRRREARFFQATEPS